MELCMDDYDFVWKLFSYELLWFGMDVWILVVPFLWFS